MTGPSRPGRTCCSGNTGSRRHLTQLPLERSIGPKSTRTPSQGREYVCFQARAVRRRAQDVLPFLQTVEDTQPVSQHSPPATSVADHMRTNSTVRGTGNWEVRPASLAVQLHTQHLCIERKATWFMVTGDTPSAGRKLVACCSTGFAQGQQGAAGRPLSMEMLKRLESMSKGQRPCCRTAQASS